MRTALFAAMALTLVTGPALAEKCPIPDDLPVPSQEMWSKFRGRCDGANQPSCLKYEWSETEYEQEGKKFKVRLQKNTCTFDVIIMANGCTNGALSGYFIRVLPQNGQMGISTLDPKTGENSYAIRAWACKPRSTTGNECSFAAGNC